MDWYSIKFLESPANLKYLIKESIGKEPSSKIATEVSTCLQQGRLFFEAAESSPIEIRPLQIFHGIVGFSKAFVAARNVVSIDTLVHVHGLKDKSENQSKLEDLRVTIEEKGTFQHFNDAVSKLESIFYFGKDAEPGKIFKNTVGSQSLKNLSISLKEILSRIPSLEKLYRQTFNCDAQCLPLSLHHWYEQRGFTDLRIDIAEYFQDRTSLSEMIGRLRSKYPFLNDWLLVGAQRAWGNSVIIFTNAKKDDIDEFSESYLVESEGRFSSARDVMCDPAFEVVDFGSILPPLAGGIMDTAPTYVQPFDGAYISEYSLSYLGAFLLSSLVRYRPQIWVHAIKGRITHNRDYDDHAMALIERFLDYSLRSFPNLVINGMKVKL